MNEPPLLQLDEVSVRFGGIVALDGVSVAARDRRVVGVIGPNGAGKTTLFNVVCGFVQPSHGHLRWRGAVLDGLRPHALAGLGIARTLQGVGLFPRLTALENVLVGAQRHASAGFVSALLALPRSDRAERELRARAQVVLDELGVGDVATRFPHELPYGIQKRVALARALVAEPALLLLDEPASGLSGEEMRELAGLIGGWRERMGVMLVEHHMDLVMSVCDEVVVLDFGRVVASGSPDSVRDDPRVIDAYLGEAVQAQGRDA